MLHERRSLTNIKLSKFPLTTSKGAIGLYFFLLADSEIDFSLARRRSLVGNLQVVAVTITLVFAIHVYEHGQSGCCNCQYVKNTVKAIA